MSVIVSCECGQQFATQKRHIGKRVACPMCGRPLTIGNTLPPPPPPSPSPTPSRSQATATSGMIRVGCTCGRNFLAPAELQGTTIACPGCQDMVLVSSADPLGLDGFSSSSSSFAADPLRLPPANHDATEKLAIKLAYIAAGSVGLLAVAIMLTSLFHSIAHVWSSQPTVAGAPATAPAPSGTPAPAQTPAAEPAKKFPSLPSFITEDYSPFGRTPAAEDSKPTTTTAPPIAPPPPPPTEDESPATPAKSTAPRADYSARPGKRPSGASPGEEPQGASDAALTRLPLAVTDWHREGSNLRGLRRPAPTDSAVESFSWLTELLPYLDQKALYDRLNFAQSPTSRGNLQVGATLIAEFLNPLESRQRWKGYPLDGLALTHFAGMSGVEDARNVVAAKLPRSDPRAGVFGYDEVARPRDITDGTSQTIMMVGTGEMASPWVLGGGGTVRGAREPLFDKTSGLGTTGVPGGGTVAVMADGSVRQISAGVEPRVFKAMSTIHGAESVDVESSAPPFALEELKAAHRRGAKSRFVSYKQH